MISPVLGDDPRAERCLDDKEVIGYLGRQNHDNLEQADVVAGLASEAAAFGATIFHKVVDLGRFASSATAAVAAPDHMQVTVLAALGRS